MGMLKNIGRKTLRLILVLLAVTAITFVIVDLLPGDTAYVIGGEEATPEDIQAIREELGLNRNIMVRYVSWLGNVVKGDLGNHT